MSGAALVSAPAANAVRAEPAAPAPKCFRPGPVVQIRFTAFAGRPRPCTLTLFGPGPEKAAERLLWELDRTPGDLVFLPAGRLAPGQLALVQQQLGDVAVLARMPGENVPSLQPGRVMPVAFVDGLSADALATGVASLQAQERR